MSLSPLRPASALPWQSRKAVKTVWFSPARARLSGFGVKARSGSLAVKAFIFNPMDEPILKEALKEPVAFTGGMFAGLLRLDLNEDPLKEWITRTVEASGITEVEVDAEGSQEEAPQQIEIE
ncbi:UPF0426 protein At1g28150, chloroplastic [Malania oleifera]|uniref:UPF0426 protein At1g28150, chloroplastic n=1 Tax=Malania oleifera TaxID=397392 RepID=UPI0025AEB588|nr:UPF0426 protein At1g28150, chloroplastic [Malania oleifera]